MSTIAARDMAPLTAYRPVNHATDRFYVRANVTPAELLRRLKRRDESGRAGRDMATIKQLQEKDVVVAVRVTKIKGEDGLYQSHDYTVMPGDYALAPVPEIKVIPEMATERGASAAAAVEQQQQQQ